VAAFYDTFDPFECVQQQKKNSFEFFSDSQVYLVTDGNKSMPSSTNID